MASIIYNSLFRDDSIGNIIVGVDTFFLLLVTSSYTPLKTHTRRSDITNEVATGGGYTAGGQPITLIGALSGSNRYDVTLGPVTWTASVIAAAGGVIYKHRGGAASADELVCYLDFGGTVTSTGGDFQVSPSSPLRIQN